MQNQSTRSRRKPVSIKIEKPSYELPNKEQKRRISFNIFSFISMAALKITAPFAVIRETRQLTKELQVSAQGTVSRDQNLSSILRGLTSDNIYWKLVYPLPIKTDLEKLILDIDYIKDKLILFNNSQLRYLKAHAQSIESRYQVAWILYAVLLMALGLYGHSFITQPYFLAFFLLCLLAVLMIIIRYIKARFLVSIIKETINIILADDSASSVKPESTTTSQPGA